MVLRLPRVYLMVLASSWLVLEAPDPVWRPPGPSWEAMGRRVLTMESPSNLRLQASLKDV